MQKTESESQIHERSELTTDMVQHLQLRRRTLCVVITTTELVILLLVLLSIVTATSSVSAFVSTVVPQKMQIGATTTRRQWQHHDALFAEKEGQTTDDDTQQQQTSHILRISKPLGIIIEEIDTSKPERGVHIGKISPGGNCCRTTDGGGRQQQTPPPPPPPPDICVNDEIIGVNGLSCTGLIFEDIMDAIVASPGDTVDLELRRPRGATVVRWPNGVGVAVAAGNGGEYLGNVAIEAGYDDRIEYDCRAGSCGVCSLIVRREDGERRVVKPCVAKVRRGGKRIFVESG